MEKEEVTSVIVIVIFIFILLHISSVPNFSDISSILLTCFLWSQVNKKIIQPGPGAGQ